MGMLKKYLPKKRWKRVVVYAASTFFVALAVDMGLTAYWRRITISKETTYITTPLLPEGTPDYIRWLNERASQGVTPENNAAVPLLRAIGIPEENAAWPARMLRALGMPEARLPKRLIPFMSWVKDQTRKGENNREPTPEQMSRTATPMELAEEKRWEDEEVATRRAPWNAADHPLWAQWLAAQPEVLALAREAAGRERYFMPAFTAREPVHPGETMASLLPSLGATRSLGMMLMADAMMHAGDADKGLFIRDMTDALKLGALLNQDPYLITRLVGNGLREDAWRGIRATLAAGDLRSNDARAMLAAVDEFPALQEIDLASERCTMLDAWCGQAVYGLSRSPLMPRPKPTVVVALVVPVRYEAQMRFINQSFDQLEKDVRIASYSKRVEAIRKTQSELFGGISRPVVRFSGYTLIVWLDNDLGLAKVCEGMQMETTQRDLTRMALALAIYRAEKGDYPETLNTLAGPDSVLKTVPLDGFSDQPFVYSREGAGYLLYSVGRNLKPDGGDEKTDLVMRMTH